MKRLLLLCAIAFISCLFFLPQPSLAAPEITIESNAGLQNKVKYEKGLPVQFVLTNAGTDFSGDLVVSFTETYSLGGGISVPIELAAGETKTIQVALPGLSDMYSMSGNAAQTIYLYEGGWEEGKPIVYKGTKYLKPSFFPPMSTFIATLTNNSDRLLALSQLSPVGSESTQVFHLNQLNQFSMPTESLAWETVDYLLIDEFAFSDFPDAAQQAVLQWVQQGGNIVVGSTENIKAEVGIFSEFLPLELGASTEVTVPAMENPIAAFDASAKEGAQVLTQQEGQVLAARQQIGAGSLTQTSFSLGDEAVSSQKGYKDLIANFFPANNNAFAANQGQSVKEYMTYEVGEVNELFESFAVSKTLIMAIIFIYIILIIPVLYIVLKKRDKREYAWVIIPGVAIITSIGLFALGAKDRISNPQIQQTGFFVVDQDKGLNGYYMDSLLSNKGGEYQFTAPATTTMTYRMNSQYMEENPQQSAILEKQAMQNQLTLRDMRYWSVASIIGQSYIDSVGDFEIQLAVKDKTVAGTIQNNFPFALEDVSIWTGTRLLALGNLNPGEALEVNETIQSNILPSASPINSSMGYQPIADKEELKKARKQTILAMSYSQFEENESSPYVIAYTNDAIVPITLEDQRPSVSALHLIAQPFSPATTLSGELELKPDAFSLNVKPLGNAGYFEKISNDPYLYYLENGDYEAVYSISNSVDLTKVNWQELTVSTSQSSAEMSILNLKTGETEAIADNKKIISEAFENYISPEGEIKFTIKAAANSGSPEVRLPKVNLKGVAAS